MKCNNCGWTLCFFGSVGLSEVYECVKCEKAWYFHDKGTVEEIKNWKKEVVK